MKRLIIIFCFIIAIGINIAFLAEGKSAMSNSNDAASLYSIYSIKDPYYNISPCYNVSNESPRMLVSPKEFKTDVYQGKSTTFGIVIEETSGLYYQS